MKVQPYLNFDGRCDEALEFYGKAIDAKVEMLIRFKESPDPHPPGMLPPGGEEKVMHSSFRVGESMLGASDGHCKGQANFQGITLTIVLADVAQSQRYFAALSEGGKVAMPLTKTFFSPSFGMVADRFGVSWMVMVEA